MPKPFKVQDKYFYKAKRDGYRARSAYKLLDIQRKFKLLKPGQVVIDLGSAPGSFLQVISQIVGPEGRAIGIDLQRIEPFDAQNIRLMQGDILAVEAVKQAMQGAGFDQVDIVTSDLAPKTSGIRDLDQGRSIELAYAGLDLAKALLKPGGHFVAKFFDGEEVQALIKDLKKDFKEVKVFKPPSCRDRSFEKFVVAQHLKAGALAAKEGDR